MARLDDRRHPMFEPHQTNPGWRIMVAAMGLGVLMAFALAYGMAAQP